MYQVIYESYPTYKVLGTYKDFGEAAIVAKQAWEDAWCNPEEDCYIVNMETNEEIRAF